MEDISNPNKDKWSDTPIDELMRGSRPLGITLIAILFFIGSFSLILLLIGSIFLYDVDRLTYNGYPIYIIEYIYQIIYVPVLFYLAYGLWKGKEWARYTIYLLFIISVIVSTIVFNIIGVLIALLLVYYLRKPHVKDFFNTEKGIKDNIKRLIIVGMIIIFILSSITAFFGNPYLFPTIRDNDEIAEKEDLLIGIWHNTEGDITMEFYTNYSCKAIKDNITYIGSWKINRHFDFAELTWNTPFMLKYPNKPDEYYLVDLVYFKEYNINLYGMFETNSYYTCIKE